MTQVEFKSSSSIAVPAGRLIASLVSCAPVDSTCSREKENVVGGRAARLAALDFTKGALVLIMVLYHWMNYFVRADGSVYKYLRFLTPSFIFIAGFLIAQVYISRGDSATLPTSKRLFVRGMKLLAIVAGLNAILSLLPLNGLKIRVNFSSPADVGMAYLVGTVPVAFSVLVPIAYVLILAAVLLMGWKYYKPIFHVACAISLSAAFLLDLEGINNSYLQIFSLGMLGISVGHIPMARLNTFLTHYIAIVAAYVAYLLAITLWDATYLLQIFGVSLSLAIIYLIGTKSGESGLIGRAVILLGQYSLFGYIAQIILLQGLRKAMHPVGSDWAVKGEALIIGMLSTILVVAALDWMRSRLNAVNKLYKMVFA